MDQYLLEENKNKDKSKKNTEDAYNCQWKKTSFKLAELKRIVSVDTEKAFLKNPTLFHDTNTKISWNRRELPSYVK